MHCPAGLCPPHAPELHTHPMEASQAVGLEAAAQLMSGLARLSKNNSRAQLHPAREAGLFPGSQHPLLLTTGHVEGTQTLVSPGSSSLLGFRPFGGWGYASRAGQPLPLPTRPGERPRPVILLDRQLCLCGPGVDGWLSPAARLVLWICGQMGQKGKSAAYRQMDEGALWCPWLQQGSKEQA